MKTIASLSGADFLRQCNRIRNEVQKYFDTTKLLEIRKHMPDFTGNETSAERTIMLNKQGRKNLNDMIDLMLDKYPEETYELLKLFVIPEKGEKIEGIELATAGLDMMSEQKVLNFLSSLAKLVQKNMQG